jgi:hypothetical protein
MIDHSGEDSGCAFYLPQVTAANYDTVTGNGGGENVGDLHGAVALVSLLNFKNSTVICETYPEAGTLPVNPLAQRETKLLVQYVDTVNGRRGTVTIPSPNLALVAQIGTDVVDHNVNVTALALTTAIENNAVSRDGNAIQVVGMRIVGRNI